MSVSGCSVAVAAKENLPNWTVPPPVARPIIHQPHVLVPHKLYHGISLHESKVWCGVVPGLITRN